MKLFLDDFVKRSHAFWKEKTVKSDPKRMYDNYTVYLEQLHDSGETTRYTHLSAFLKLSSFEPVQYLDGWPSRNTKPYKQTKK